MTLNEIRALTPEEILKEIEAREEAVLQLVTAHYILERRFEDAVNTIRGMAAARCSPSSDNKTYDYKGRLH